MNFEIDSVYLYNSDGVKLMDVSDAAIITAEVDDRVEKFEKSLYFNKEMGFTSTIETTPEAYNEILKQTDPHEYTLKYTKYVQARRHHKRRINKKWLKKYGYKERTIVIDGLKITNTERNGDEEICRYTMNLVKE